MNVGGELLTEGPYIVKRLLKNGFLDCIGYVEHIDGEICFRNSHGGVMKIDYDLDLTKKENHNMGDRYHPSELEKCANITSFIADFRRLADFYEGMISK